jgi:hypothetical protein
MAYTPGPWRAIAGWPSHIWHVLLADRETEIIVARGDGDSMSNEEVAANARLVAAAPDLLAALKEVAEGCEYRLRKGEDSGDRHTLGLCRTAIAKAEGRVEV